MGLGDDDEPGRLVRRLEATLGGVRWLIAEWTSLASLLEPGKVWQGPDKLKSAHLLGCQPIAAASVRAIAEIFVASWVIHPERESPFAELRSELSDHELKVFIWRVHGRWTGLPKSGETEKARQVLIGIVGQAIDRLTRIAAELEDRAEEDAIRTADCLSFDESRGGELIRRYELAHHRALLRTIADLVKLKRTTDDQGPCIPIIRLERSARPRRSSRSSQSIPASRSTDRARSPASTQSLRQAARPIRAATTIPSSKSSKRNPLTWRRSSKRNPLSSSRPSRQNHMPRRQPTKRNPRTTTESAKRNPPEWKQPATQNPMPTPGRQRTKRNPLTRRQSTKRNPALKMNQIIEAIRGHCRPRSIAQSRSMESSRPGFRRQSCKCPFWTSLEDRRFRGTTGPDCPRATAGAAGIAVMSTRRRTVIMFP